MPDELKRRDVLKSALTLAGLMSLGWPEFILPALAADEEVVPFTDFPGDFNPKPRPGVRVLDTRTIQSFITPSDQFFTIQHYGRPVMDPSTYRLKISGLVERSREWALDELKKKPRTEFVAGFECSGNGKGRMNGLIGNARWAGTPLSGLLKECGLQAQARESFFSGRIKGWRKFHMAVLPLRSNSALPAVFPSRMRRKRKFWLLTK